MKLKRPSKFENKPSLIIRKPKLSKKLKNHTQIELNQNNINFLILVLH